MCRTNHVFFRSLTNHLCLRPTGWNLVIGNSGLQVRRRKSVYNRGERMFITEQPRVKVLTTVLSTWCIFPQVCRSVLPLAISQTFSPSCALGF